MLVGSACCFGEGRSHADWIRRRRQGHSVESDVAERSNEARPLRQSERPRRKAEVTPDLFNREWTRMNTNPKANRECRVFRIRVYSRPFAVDQKSRQTSPLIWIPAGYRCRAFA